LARKGKTPKASANVAGKTEDRGLLSGMLPFYIVLVVVFVLYVLLQSTGLGPVLGVLVFVLIVAIFAMELSHGVKEEGYKRNVLEIAAAVMVVLVLWFGLKALLHTNSPIDVVPSCSMLPYLHRGDMIFLGGANQTTIKAPMVDVSTADWNKVMANLSSVSLECVAYEKSGSQLYVSQIVEPGYSVGLVETSGINVHVVPNDTRIGGVLGYTCGAASAKFQNGTVEQEAYTKAVTIGNRTIQGDVNNTIVVYGTVPQDLFYKLGDSYVVHRAYAIVNADGAYYVLTKGDNNPGLDIQYSNYPAGMGQIEGKVIADVPYLGYLKLILSGSYKEPSGCNSTLLDS
jgi:signal peptidase I